MVNCEFKKSYNFFLGLIVFSLVGLVATVVIAIVLNAYGVIVAGAVFAALALFCAFKYLVLKKQFLKVDNDGLHAYVITYKSAQKPMKIETKLSFLTGVSYKHNVLILTNERGQDLTIYNLKDAKKAAEDINNFISAAR